MASPEYTSIDALYAHYLQHSQVTTDSRSVPTGSLFFALKGERFDGNQYAQKAITLGAAFAVVDDPDVATQIGAKALLVPDGLKALQQLAHHHRLQLKMPILAITGSNGKTTSKELVASVMSQQYKVHFTAGNFNNHIGLPLTILQIGPDIEMAILEMGANHQGEIAELSRIAAPTHGLITNIGEAHLEGFGGIEGVKIGKGELYHYLAENGGVAFVNLDSEHLPTMAREAGIERSINYLSSEQPTLMQPAIETKLLATSPNVVVAIINNDGNLLTAHTNLPGIHNFENVKTAVAVGKYFKVPPVKIVAGLEGYLPENNRSQRISLNGINFFLDAYNANPSSVAASLKAFVEMCPAPRTAILGDMLELGDVSPAAHLRIATLAMDLGLDQVVLVGPLYAKAAQALNFPHFPDAASVKKWFWEQDIKGHTVFIKASRSIQLETLLA